jgi:hypothetical protein
VERVKRHILIFQNVKKTQQVSSTQGNTIS